AIDYTLPVASAQVKSALLLAALYAAGESRIGEPVATRDHTERMLQTFGVRLARDQATIRIGGGQRLQATQVQVPGDFSSAAFFIVAGCLAAHEGLTIRNVGCNPTRTGLLEMLSRMGARIEVREQPRGPQQEPVADIYVRASRLKGIRVPESLVALAIDEFPVFFIAAAAAEGRTVVSGAAELRVKESDRLAVMADGLQSLGVACELAPDGLALTGRPEGLSGGHIDSRGDHRIAMAFAVASLVARAPIRVDDVANVATSFPDFVALGRSVGLAI